MNYNSVVKTEPNAISAEGGEVYYKKLIDGWMNHLFVSLNENTYYESQAVQEERFLNSTQVIADEYGYEFVAKAAMFARNELGMRSISQLLAAWLSNKTFKYKRRFYANYCHRPDDVSSVFAAAAHLGIKRNHSMCRGFGDYLSTLGDYDLTKYKQKNHEYNMYDVINLTHPKSHSVDKFMQGEIKSANTWEVKISTSESEEEKAANWIQLVEKYYLGYIALIRNLNNILSAAPNEKWIKDYLVPQIENEVSIHTSLIFPYQIYTAYKNLRIKNVDVVYALSNAFRISVSNMPELPGTTAIILDVSGSMDQPISYRSNINIKEIGAVYAAAITLKNRNTRIIKFGNDAKEYDFVPYDNIFTQIYNLQDNDDYLLGRGTDIGSAYQYMNFKCDRIFLISDMQIMNKNAYNNYWSRSRRDGVKCYKDYCNQFGNVPIYSFDLGNYSTQTDNPNNPYVHLCTTLSEKVFNFITLLESDIDIVDYINDMYNYY